MTSQAPGGAILIYAPDEHTREAFKSALNKHLPLIVTESRAQCLAAAAQKAPLAKAFIAACSADGDPDIDIFKEISSLRPALKIIAVGDNATEEMSAEALRHGAAGYMLMPLKADAILALARRAEPLHP